MDDEESDDYFMTVTDYLTPTSLFLGTVGKGAPEKLKQLPAFFDAKGLAVSQHEAVSKDGTRIPYFQVARKDLALDGKNPTLLYGYGGFETSEVPGLQPRVRGRRGSRRAASTSSPTSAAAASSGPKWHQAALKANRHKAYEDFIAVAEDLVRRKVTTTPHLGIRGGSNGGLLVGNMLTMRPDLFGAIVCQAPLLDMRRYNTLLAGASWMGEYGNPDDPKEWEFIQDLLAVPQPEGRREVPAHPLHDLHARRPRAPRPRPQDDGPDDRTRSRTSSTTRTSRAATAAPPTTSSRPT